MRIFPIVRRIVASAVTNVRADVAAALGISPVVDGAPDRPQATAGVAAAQAPATLVSAQNPAVSAQPLGTQGSADPAVAAAGLAASVVLSDLAVPAAPAVAASLLGADGTAALPAARPALNAALATSGDPARPESRPALDVDTRVDSATVRPAQTPAPNIVQVTYSLVHRSGGSGVPTQEAGCTGRTDWTDAGNGAGLHDGSTDSLSGSVTGARDGIYVLGYADFANKTDLTITQVRLIFYTEQAGTALNNGDHDRRWRKNAGAWTVLETFTGDQNDRTNGEAYDITGSITGWSDLDSIEAGVRQCCDLGENLIVGRIDAVELEVTATKTDTL